MRESVVQAAIMAYLARRGDVMYWRNNTGAYSPAPGQFVKYGAVGSADILGVWAPSGRFLAIEVKTPTGKISAAQRQWGNEVIDRGGIYIVARSVSEVEVALCIQK